MSMGERMFPCNTSVSNEHSMDLYTLPCGLPSSIPYALHTIYADKCFVLHASCSPLERLIHALTLATCLINNACEEVSL